MPRLWTNIRKLVILLKFQQHKTLENMFKRDHKSKNTQRYKRLFICNSKENQKKTASKLLIV